jgi:hypothetical protein
MDDLPDELLMWIFFLVQPRMLFHGTLQAMARDHGEHAHAEVHAEDSVAVLRVARPAPKALEPEPRVSLTY